MTPLVGMEMVVLLYFVVDVQLLFTTFPVTVTVPAGLKMIVLAPVKIKPPLEAAVLKVLKVDAGGKVMAGALFVKPSGKI